MGISDFERCLIKNPNITTCRLHENMTNETISFDQKHIYRQWITPQEVVGIYYKKYIKPDRLYLYCKVNIFVHYLFITVIYLHEKNDMNMEK